MAEHDNQYDPYIPSSGAPAAASNQTAPGNQRTAALQASFCLEIGLAPAEDDVLFDDLNTRLATAEHSSRDVRVG
ncbi:MAG: hypothetical protein M1818_002172 [Claussenomyces sp. TS43310]|nr:MAG: hypothetical protein M1818_002172 [Claussenomyces sp. TS43310]